MSQQEADQAFADLLDGHMSNEEAAAFLTTLAERGETAIEIEAAACALRVRIIEIEAPKDAIDVCGTAAVVFTRSTYRGI